jgi:hypothetical protein
MEEILFAPPVVFIIFFIIFFASSKAFSRYSRRGVRGEHDLESYACGQRNVEHYVNPDYSEFFPFAFFFTIMHVLVLVIATAPYDALLFPAIYIMSGILAMAIIFRR